MHNNSRSRVNRFLAVVVGVLLVTSAMPLSGISSSPIGTAAAAPSVLQSTTSNVGVAYDESRGLIYAVDGAQTTNTDIRIYDQTLTLVDSISTTKEVRQITYSNETDRIYVAGDSVAMAYDAETHSQIYSTATAQYDYGITVNPSTGVAYVATYTDIYAINPDGSIKWTFYSGADNARFDGVSFNEDLDQLGFICSNNCNLGSMSGDGIGALDTSGSLVWTNGNSVRYEGLDAYQGYFYAASNWGHVRKFNSSGSVVAQYDTVFGSTSDTPGAVEADDTTGKVYVGRDDNDYSNTVVAQLTNDLSSKEWEVSMSGTRVRDMASDEGDEDGTVKLYATGDGETAKIGTEESTASLVSGTVKNASGSGLDSATVEVVETGATTSTSSDGSYSFELGDGDYTIEATKTGYNKGSTSVSVSGSDVTGADITLSRDQITGQVTNQEGAPIENATVVGYVAEWSTVEESRSQLEDLSNPIPKAWRDLEDNPDLLGEYWNGDKTESYVSTHTRDALPNTAPWLDNPNLDDTATVDLPAGEPIVLAAWDADASGVGVNRCIPAVSNEYDCQMPGEHESSATIVIERIGPGGDITDRSTVELTETSGGGYLDPDDFAYASVELSPGFYYIHEEGAPKGVPRKVGDLTGLIDRYQENAEGALSQHAKEVEDHINANRVTRVTATTDQKGQYSLPVSTTAKVVEVHAYYGPAIVEEAGKDPATVTQRTLITEYNSALSKLPSERSETEAAIANSSVYLPSSTKRVEPPTTGVDLSLYEYSAPPGVNSSAQQDQLERLEELFNQLNFADVTSTIEDRLDARNEADLRSIYSELVGIVKQYEPVRERYLELSARDEIAAPSELSASELRTEIGHLNNALYSTDLTGPITPPEPPDVGDGTLSTSWDVEDVDLSEANVSVVAHWSNGTSQVVDEKYIKKETAFGADTVHLKDFPIGDTDPAAVQFSLRIATEEEYRERRDPFKNPTYAGELPRLDSIALSSVTPGPNENVSVAVTPAEMGSFKQVTGVTAYGPDGSTLSTSGVSDGRRFSFTTAGAGVHTLELELENTGGEKFVVPVRVKAIGTDQNAPPRVTARSSTVGTYALVGNGLEAGSVHLDNGNQEVTVVAQVGQDDPLPQNLHVHLEEVALGGDVETTVRVTRGDSGESVSGHVPLTIHHRQSREGVLIWRNGDPITEDGTRHGEYSREGNQLTIRSYTDQGGTVTIRKINNPTYIQRLNHWLDVQLSNLPWGF